MSRTLPTIAGILVMGLALIALAGCGRSPNPPDADSAALPSDDPSTATRSAAALPPVGVELSVVAGVSIRRRPDADADAEQSLATDRSGFKVRNTSLYDLICQTCPTDATVLNDAPLPEGHYDVTVNGVAKDAVWPTLTGALARSFHVRFRESKDIADVHVLIRDPARPLTLTPSTGKNSSYGTEQTSGGFGYKFTASTMEKLVGVLEDYAGTSVLDETGVTGKFDFELAMDHWHPKTVFAAVEKLGLKLAPAKRPVNALHVESAAAPLPASQPAGK